MGLLKEKKALKAATHVTPGASSETSPRRPYQIEKLAPCMNGCPQGTNIRGILMTIAQAEKYEKSYDQAFAEAWDMLTEKNPLPAICGRVCPHPCEDNCNRKEKDGALAVNNVERFIGDWGLEHGFKFKKLTDEKRPQKIAIIGAGPAGLSCAYHLARRGYSVTIYEAFPKSGGMLRYGIPAYRLPREVIDSEVQNILDLGVELKTSMIIGKDVAYEDLQKQYDAIFVGIGAHGGKLLRVPGEDADNVQSGVQFLRQVNSDKPPDVGKKVIVIGGGDTAIDAARVSRRLGAEVSIIYRRTRTEMPAIEEEIVGALEEGVDIRFLAAPLEVLRENGRVIGMRFQEMELGEPDESGRRRPVPIPGKEFSVDCNFVIPAVSQEPDWGGLDHLHEGRDWVKADGNGKTQFEKTFAGGDVLDLGLVTIAIYQGRRAAETIEANFRGETLVPPKAQQVITADKIMLNYYEKALRHECEKLSVETRLANPETEISHTLTMDAVIAEAKRCMSCGSCFDCGTCWSYCQDQAIVKSPTAGEPYRFKLEFCKGCDKCAQNCPCGYLEMKDPLQRSA